jgi:outer membrane protein OmpA-like peptidoglycan-associated protein
VDYLVKQGIDKSRLKAVGYGEKMILNRCKNGVKCSEAEHAVNRRTEFKLKEKE